MGRRDNKGCNLMSFCIPSRECCYQDTSLFSEAVLTNLMSADAGEDKRISGRDDAMTTRQSCKIKAIRKKENLVRWQFGNL